jgi:O-antigen ligase
LKKIDEKGKVKLLKLLNEFKEVSQKLLLLALLLIFIGFTASRALLSIGMGLIVVAALLNLRTINFKTQFSCKAILAPTLLFVAVALSFFWSENKSIWWNFTRVHLPFLILPLSFWTLKSFSKRQFEIIVITYVLAFLASTLLVLGNYFWHFKNINEQIIRGGSIPMPYSHIRYALLVVMAFFASLWLSMNSQFISKKFSLAVAAFFFLVIHILSVRSAIFSLYAALIVFLFYQLKSWGVKKVSLVFAVVIVFVSIIFFTVPSLKNKINYMRYDLREYANNNNLDASDGMRLRSWKAGWEVALRQPFYGAGYGDIYDEMSKWYEQHFPELQTDQKKLPHNQFLWWWLSIGWLGLFVSIAALLFPLIVNWNRVDWLIKVFYVVLFTSFLWEPTLEEQMGTGFCIVWLMLLIHLKEH